MKDASTLSLEPSASHGKVARYVIRTLLALGALIIVAVLAWQGFTAAGNPDPTAPKTSALVAILDIAVLVFREGLECILVLSAITASMIGANQSYRRPIAAGAGIGFLVTLVTWFVAVGIISDLSNNVSALNLQAATGLLAVIVLLIVMNWFFHKIYWGGWISMHNRRKKDLIQDDKSAETTKIRLLWGLGLLGFASVYREGFEIVLFLQSYYLKLGGQTVLLGTLLGLFFTAIVAVLNFVAHQRLPYRKMMILTGIMLGFVLLVMVGEQAYEMQQANWIPTTNITRLQHIIPDWAGVWFSLYPTVETIVAQLLAAILVIGSYYLARHLSAKGSRPDDPAPAPA
jgi:high-affinity iron transporter